MGGTTRSTIVPIPKFITILLFSLSLVLSFFAPGAVYSFFKNDLVKLVDYFMGKSEVSYNFMTESWVWAVGGGIGLLYMASKLEKLKIVFYGLIVGLVARLLVLQTGYEIPNFIVWLRNILWFV